MKSMAVFDAPPVPGCWRGGEVIRIVDPLGLQVAWVAPALAGGIVGYYVREGTGDGWTEVLACSERTGRQAGSALLLRDESSGELMPVQATDTAWTFASRDPTQTTVSGMVASHHLSVTMQCADGALHVEISTEAVQRQPAVGLRLYLGADLGRPDLTNVAQAEVGFSGGTLKQFTLESSPRMACQAQVGPGNDYRVDLVPDQGSPVGKPALPVSITLTPQPAQPTTVA